MFLISLIILTIVTGSSAVINGTITRRFRYPYLVSLQWDLRHKCGGVLLNANTILTVAHCYPLVWVEPKQPQRVSALIGTRNQQGGRQKGAVRVGIRRVIWPDSFPDQFKWENMKKSTLFNAPIDYIILKTTIPVQKSRSIDYATLGTDLAGRLVPKDGDHCIAVGWGRFKSPDTTNMTAEIFPKLARQGVIKIVSMEVCGTEQLHSMMCAQQVIEDGSPKGMPCFGDSGSPLVCKSEGGVEYLAGLVEAGNVPCNEQTDPILFMRISTVRQWIQKHI